MGHIHYILYDIVIPIQAANIYLSVLQINAEGEIDDIFSQVVTYLDK